MNRCFPIGVPVRAAVVAFAAGAVFSSGVLGQAQSGTYDLVLTAKVRDFASSHPDFCKPPSFGQMWVEGAVAPTLTNGRPVYTGQGKRVVAAARDGAGHDVAQSMIDETVLVSPQGVKLVNSATYKNNPTVDSYDPAVGPYGGSNVGPAPTFATGQAMPTVTVPNITPYIAAPTYNGAAVVSSSFRCATFMLHQDDLLIQGDVTIVVDAGFDVGNSSHIELAPGARLTFYLLGTAVLMNHSTINSDTQATDRVTIYKLGTSDFTTKNHTLMCATIIAPDALVSQSNNSDVFGTITAKNLDLQHPTSLHVAEPTQTACSMVNDTPAQSGAPDPAAVSSAQSFGQWFDNVAGVNMDAQARLLFQKEPGGVLEFSANDFHPIDGELMDQGGYGVNRNFTLEMDGDFYYTPCTGQFFEFFGDGDAYVYVDGKLVMELAGNNMGVKQYVDIDRLGLNPGQTHELKFFYAQRSCGASRFQVRTNVELMTQYVVEAETMYLLD